MKPIENHKEVCRNLAPDGWTYGGFDEGYYFFQAGSYREGFRVMDLLEEDLTSKNIKYMADNNLTRVRGHRYE